MSDIPANLKNKSLFEWVFFVGSLIAILVTLLTGINEFNKFFTNLTGINFDKDAFPITAEILNIIILVMFYFLISPKTLEFKNDKELEALAKALNIQPTEKSQSQIELAKFNNNRINTLVKQLVTSIALFITFLLLFYIINLIIDFKPSFLTSNESTNGFSKEVIILNFLRFFENAFNIASAVFIYLGFKILFNRTLDENNHSLSYHRGPIMFLMTYIVLYIIFLLAEPENKDVAIIFRLICGFYNGLAMGLLFGRLTSMEYFFKEINLDRSQITQKLYLFGTIFILPLYVLAQPMYGVFDTSNQFQEPFKAIIFIVCFIGKAYFLLLLYNYINSKWIHVYLHLALANHTIPKNIAENFPQIEGVRSELDHLSKLQIIEKLTQQVKHKEYEKCLYLVERLNKLYHGSESKDQVFLVYKMNISFENLDYAEMLKNAIELKKILE
jgi:hypothetical protein